MQHHNARGQQIQGFSSVTHKTHTRYDDMRNGQGRRKE